MKASVLEFRLGSDIFCFNTKDISYVFELEEYTDVHGVNEAVLGVVRYNRDIMPLVDTLYLYSQKHLDIAGEKSVVVIHDSQNNIYGMLVDEILKIEELDVVHPTVDMNSEDLVINHYKDKEKIVNEIYPLPLLKKNHIMAMKQEESLSVEEERLKSNTKEYLLFRVDTHFYALESKDVKEVLEGSESIFELESQGHLLGAVAVRDEVISVANLSKAKESDSIIIVELENKKVALLVDEVYDIESFKVSKIEFLKDKESATNAFYNFDNKVVAIVDPRYYIQQIEAKQMQESKEDLHNSNRHEYLTFVIAGKRFAIDMRYVRQVVETEMLSKTESSSIIANTNIRFIATWNKTAVSVADISRELGIESFNEEHSQTLFVEYEEQQSAFLIDEVEDIVYLKDDEIKYASDDDSIIGGAILVDDAVLVKLNEKYLVENI